VLGTAGASLRWHRDVLGGGEPYRALDEAAARVPPGAGGAFFYPHLAGATSPHWQVEARGAFHGLSLSTSRPELTRAVLEGVAFQIRQNLEVLEELIGPAREIILFGGGARSRLWQEIIGAVATAVGAIPPAAENRGPTPPAPGSR
jgi:xylulokinase